MWPCRSRNEELHWLVGPLMHGEEVVVRGLSVWVEIDGFGAIRAEMNVAHRMYQSTYFDSELKEYWFWPLKLDERIAG